jgi:hypothetical protein
LTLGLVKLPFCPHNLFNLTASVWNNRMNNSVLSTVPTKAKARESLWAI